MNVIKNRPENKQQNTMSVAVDADGMMTHNRDNSMGGVLWLLLGLIALITTTISLLPKETAKTLIMENGVVELATAIGYLITTVVLLWSWNSNKSGSVLASSVVVFCLGLRELDFHSRFTTMGIFKSKFYVSPDVPIVEKTIVTVIVLGMLVLLIQYFRKNGPVLLDALRNRQPWAFAAMAALISIVLSKVLDGNSEPLQFVLTFVHPAPDVFIWALEEVMEMMIPAFIFVATIRHRRVVSV